MFNVYSDYSENYFIPYFKIFYLAHEELVKRTKIHDEIKKYGGVP